MNDEKRMSAFAKMVGVSNLIHAVTVKTARMSKKQYDEEQRKKRDPKFKKSRRLG